MLNKNVLEIIKIIKNVKRERCCSTKFALARQSKLVIFQCISGIICNSAEG